MAAASAPARSSPTRSTQVAERFGLDRRARRAAPTPCPTASSACSRSPSPSPAQPQVLLLDEPAAGVPEAERRDLLDAIAALPRDVSVLLIEHDMDLVFSFARAHLGAGRRRAAGRRHAGGDRRRSARARRLSRRERAMADLLAARAACRPATATPSCCRDVALPLREGEALAVLGRNGVGKTTLLNTHRRRDAPLRAARSRSAAATSTRCAPETRARAGHRLGAAGAQHLPARSPSRRTSPPSRGPGRGRRARLRACSRACRSGAATSATSCPAASSRCWRSAARWCSTRACCCSTSRPKGWRRSSSRSCCAR